jgi:hypothetical protein
LELSGKESQVGPGRAASEAREVIHHHYAGPSGEMFQKGNDSESDSDDEIYEKK